LWVPSYVAYVGVKPTPILFFKCNRPELAELKAVLMY